MSLGSLDLFTADGLSILLDHRKSETLTDMTHLLFYPEKQTHFNPMMFLQRGQTAEKTNTYF